MPDETATHPRGWLPRKRGGADQRRPLALVLAWSQSEPARVGEVAAVSEGTTWVLGRASSGDGEPRLAFRPARPGAGDGAPLASPGLSRRQLLVRAEGERLVVERVGRAELRVGGRRVARAEVAEGATLEIEGEAVLFCVAREPMVSGGVRPTFAFGAPDTHGLVGESARVWALRDELAMVARRPGHVLVVGPSGAGKESCAKALHALSDRAKGPFVARNAATIPQGILDAELFGNARNYPNAGMPERAGLLGASDGGTLFLDEIGELPEEQQAHLLRVLDDGEYHRLGEDKARRTDVRVIAATNRTDRSLKHDFAARFKLGLDVPGLDERREDLPILARHLLRRLAERDPSISARAFEGDEPRIAPELVIALLEHRWTGHVRELESLLLLALAHSREHFLALTPAVEARLQRASPAPPSVELTKEDIERALELAGGNVSRAWEALGLPSRDALNRLIKKLGVTVRR